jgi:vitamin B12 transporter
MKKHLLRALCFSGYSIMLLHSTQAQIPINNTNNEDDDNIDNPIVTDKGFLYSTGLADTGSDTRYFIQPLNSITIQGNRLQMPFAQQNRNITVLDQSMIRALPVKSVAELLTYVAGVDVRQRGPWGTQADISIDGGTFDQTVVLINGIKMTDPQTGHNMMNLPVPMEAIDRIEIMKGPAARLYGANALNGVINIITKKPLNSGIKAHLYSGSNFNKDTASGKLYGGAGLQLLGEMVGKNSQQLLAFGTDHATGYRYNTAFKNYKGYYQNNMDLNSAARLQFMAGYTYNHFGANGFYAAPGDVESEETVQTGIVGIGAQIKMNEYWQLKPRVSYRYNHDDYLYIRQKPDMYRNKHETQVVNAELNNVFHSSIGDFGLGLDWRMEHINSSNLGKWTRNNSGIYAEYSFTKIPLLLVNIGAYANYNSDFGWKILPGIDLGYNFYKNWRAFANAGTGQRFPTYTDWYYKGPTNIGNAALTPENAYNIEAGIKFNTNQLNISSSYFYKHTSDFIDWVKDSVTAPWQPQNFQQINAHGLNFAIDYRWRQAQQTIETPIAVITGMSYTYLNATIANPNQGQNTNVISKYALDNFKHQLCAYVNLEVYNRITLSIAARYLDRMQYTSYTLLDAKLSYNHKQFSVYADVNNVLNTNYKEAGAVPMPGRWATLGLKWHWRK